MEKHFDPKAAEAAQINFTNTFRCPMFAPKDGICHRCGRNIYGVYRNSSDMVFGYSVEHAETHLITGCPFCNASFVD